MESLLDRFFYVFCKKPGLDIVDPRIIIVDLLQNVSQKTNY